VYAANGVVRGLDESMTKRTCVDEFLFSNNNLNYNTVFDFGKM
jgi:hypothetical protein